MILSAPAIMGIIFTVSETIIGRRRASAKTAQLKDRRSLGVLGIVIWSSILLSVIAARRIPGARIAFAPQMLPFTVVLFAAGLLFRWYCIWVLGRFFTVNVAIAHDHRLVESGPYRYLRHPSYTGGLLAFAALGLAMGNYVSFALLTIPVFFAFRRRMEVEEQALLENFGDAYRDYMRRTKRLVPFVY